MYDGYATRYREDRLKHARSLPSKERLPLAEHLWNEYQHRHNLVWDLVFRLTAAVVLLSIVPYTQLEVTGWLGLWILAPPILGVASALFGFRRIWHELTMLDHVRQLYWGLQNSLFYTFYDQDKNTFGWYVRIYIGFLVALAVINILIVDACWLPYYLPFRILESLVFCPQ